MTNKDFAISKVIGNHSRSKVYKPFRAYDAVKDSIMVDITYNFIMEEDDGGVIEEYDGESKQQFYPHYPHIGCAVRHLSVIADKSSDLTLFHAGSARQALYR